MTPTEARQLQEEAVRLAVQEVLWNVSNYPKAVQARLLGQDISALSAKVVAAALEAFLPTDETETVSIEEQTNIVRQIDADFASSTGGTTRHWVQSLNERGYRVVPVTREAQEPTTEHERN